MTGSTVTGTSNGTSNGASAGTSIEVRHRYRASRERVFAAWTDAEQLERWYAPVEGWVVSRIEVDARAGGGYHVEFGPPGGPPVIEDGVYAEFDPPSKLVIHVRVGGVAGAEETIATVTFVEDGDETEVVIVEQGYADEQIAQTHRAGWATTLRKLEQAL